MALIGILRSFAMMLVIIAMAMSVPLVVALLGGEESAGSYLFALSIALMVGGGAYAASLGHRMPSGFRGAFIVILSWWIVVPVFAAIPIMAEGFKFADAYFEAVSAMTTTGAWLSNSGAIASKAGALWRAAWRARFSSNRCRDFY